MATTTQFDSYFFGSGLVDDARKGVAQAVARTRAAGLPVEGYASSPAPQSTKDPFPGPTAHSDAAPGKPADKEPKKSGPDESIGRCAEGWICAGDVCFCGAEWLR